MPLILKRTWMVYLIATIIMLKITNFGLIHFRCWYALKERFIATEGQDIDTAIYYWDYVRRRDPANLEALEQLAKYYLIIKDDARATETLNTALCTAPANTPETAALFKTYTILSSRTQPDCKRVTFDSLLQLRNKFTRSHRQGPYY